MLAPSGPAGSFAEHCLDGFDDQCFYAREPATSGPRPVVAISGDTAVCDAMHELAQGVDVLVHEALLSSRVAADLLTWNASARAVGKLAARTRPDTLVLTHLIPAPRSPDDERAYVEEVRTGGFEGRVLVARDLLHVDTET